jgi:hypothetical protein
MLACFAHAKKWKLKGLDYLHEENNVDVEQHSRRITHLDLPQLFLTYCPAFRRLPGYRIGTVWVPLIQGH